VYALLGGDPTFEARAKKTVVGTATLEKMAETKGECQTIVLDARSNDDVRRQAAIARQAQKAAAIVGNLRAALALHVGVKTDGDVALDAVDRFASAADVAATNKQDLRIHLTNVLTALTGLTADRAATHARLTAANRIVYDRALAKRATVRALLNKVNALTGVDDEATAAVVLEAKEKADDFMPDIIQAVGWRRASEDVNEVNVGFGLCLKIIDLLQGDDDGGRAPARHLDGGRRRVHGGRGQERAHARARQVPHVHRPREQGLGALRGRHVDRAQRRAHPTRRSRRQDGCRHQEGVEKIVNQPPGRSSSTTVSATAPPTRTTSRRRTPCSST